MKKDYAEGKQSSGGLTPFLHFSGAGKEVNMNDVGFSGIITQYLTWLL